MHVAAVGGHGRPAIARPNHAHFDHKVKAGAQPLNDSPNVDALATDDADQAASSPEVKRGVIRHLMEGHFRGVADIRLRLNFQDELREVTLPPVSEPRGNGVAYAKFLQLYEESLTEPEAETEEPQEELVETLA